MIIFSHYHFVKSGWEEHAELNMKAHNITDLEQMSAGFEIEHFETDSLRENI